MSLTREDNLAAATTIAHLEDRRVGASAYLTAGADRDLHQKALSGCILRTRCRGVVPTTQKVWCVSTVVR